MPLVSHPTDRERCLAELKAHPGEWINLYDRLHVMVHSRIPELRAEGHVIPQKYFPRKANGKRDSRYRLEVG